MTSTHSLWQFIRREPVLSISFVCALVSAFFVPPSAAYVDYIDLRVLCLLFCLMAVVAGDVYKRQRRCRPWPWAR